MVAGDAEYWDVSAAENVAYVKPLEAGVASNVTLVAESGRVWALLVAESSGEDPDLVVYVDGPERAALAEAPRHAPAFVAGGEVAAHVAEEEAARAELRAIEEAAAEEVSARLERARRRVDAVARRVPPAAALPLPARSCGGGAAL